MLVDTVLCRQMYQSVNTIYLWSRTRAWLITSVQLVLFIETTTALSQKVESSPRCLQAGTNKLALIGSLSHEYPFDTS